MPVKARDSERRKGRQHPTKPKPPAKPVALIRGHQNQSQPHRQSHRRSQARVHHCQALWSRPRGNQQPGKVNYPSGRVLINTNTYLTEGSLAIRLPLPRDCSPLSIGADSGRSSVKLMHPVRQRYLSQKPQDPTVRKAAAIDLLILWHESDLPVDHDPAPVAIKDFMHEPGAPTSYLEFGMYNCRDWWLPFIAFYTTPETIPMDDSDIDIIYVKTTINPIIQETPITIKPDPDGNFKDPLQSIIRITRQVINLNDDDEDEEFQVEDMENIKQNDADFDNMAVTEHEGGTGNDIESQALKDEMINNVYEDWLADLMNNENFRERMWKSCLHPHQIVAVNRMVEKENGLEQDSVSLGIDLSQVNKYEQSQKQPPPGLEQRQIKIDDI
ncbi:hypothetical protein BDD12DRAFT_803350 [Trichophaea hybrida]|nr:hypothetical protein BDD12DRAFT_803350 [Trichophaea hybrida]